MAAITAGSNLLSIPKHSLSVESHSFSTFNGLKGISAPAVTLSLRTSSVSSRKAFHVKAATTLAPTFTKLQPLGDRILVKIQQQEEKSVGGILLPTTAQSKPQGGEVVAVGDGRSLGDKKIAVDVPVGSNIVYSKYAGTEIEFNGSPHLLLKEDDAIGVLDSEDVKELKPLNDRVLIKVLETEAKTAGGVLLTDSAKEKPVVGTVVATGPGPLGEDGSRKALELGAGSLVLYSKFAGNEFKNKEGAQFVVLRASDVMAVLS